MVSSLLSVHPVGPEIWGACRMLLSVWFADSPLLRSPRKKTYWCDSCSSTWSQPGSFAWRLLPPLPLWKYDFSSSTYRNKLTTWHFLPHTVWSRLGMISRGKRHGDVHPAFSSVNRYVAVSGSGSLRSAPRLPLPANYGCEMWIWRHKRQFVGFCCTSQIPKWLSFLFHCIFFLCWRKLVNKKMIRYL